MEFVVLFSAGLAGLDEPYKTLFRSVKRGNWRLRLRDWAVFAVVEQDGQGARQGGTRRGERRLLELASDCLSCRFPPMQLDAGGLLGFPEHWFDCRPQSIADEQA